MLPVLIKKSGLMINIGKMNQLHVEASFPFGYQLLSPYDQDTTVVLPHEHAPEGIKIGDVLNVFVYNGEDGNLAAYPHEPDIETGKIFKLKAAGATAFGGFFECGLPRDLLVPKDLQESTINPGFYYPVYVFYDEKTDRLLGATKLHPFFRERNPELSEGEKVDLMVYAKTDLGFKMVINNTYLGLLFHSDAYKHLKIGDTTEGFIKSIREDGKIDVALQLISKAARDELQQAILDDLEAHGGLSTLTDKSPAEEIYQRFGVSKAAYKKAIGALYKQRKITLSKQAITLAK